MLGNTERNKNTNSQMEDAVLLLIAKLFRWELLSGGSSEQKGWGLSPVKNPVKSRSGRDTRGKVGKGQTTSNKGAGN